MSTLPMPLVRAMIDLDTPARMADYLLPTLAADPTTLAIAVSRRGQLESPLIAPLAGRLPLAYLGRYDGAALVLTDSTSADQGLREIGLELSAADAAYAAVAVALRQWQADSHCVACGAPAALIQSGWVFRCTNCGAERYPRTDPCIIVAVTDEADRLLLARAAHFAYPRASVLAGYVEPGESLEAAVAREVFEEAGIHVHDVSYRGSQPWPFPRSLMCAFTARTSGTPEPVIDGEEIVEAAFLSREDVAARIAAGTLQLPSGISVARSLVSDWLESPA